ncbi:MAG: Crp/Fnr family transcriptional regulator [Myxococcaceae bacterium]|nr:Crp/Fnr family transcriptional regulator [Myxococcaceae bacterium]
MSASRSTSPPAARDRELLAQFVHAVCPARPESVGAFVAAFRPATLPAGGVFAEAGTLALEVGFLLRGAMRCFFLTEDGNEYTKDFFRPLSFVAAPSSLFARQPSTVTITALERSELLVIDGDALERLYDAHPDLGRFGRKVIERVYSEREVKEYELAVLDAEGRYRRFLQRHADLEARLRPADVSSYLGITQMQLSRVKRKLRT